jgi:hypothetical protein
MKNISKRLTLLVGACILVSCGENSGKATPSSPENPYSQYGGGYKQYQQYGKPIAPETSEVNLCEDLNWDSNCLCERQKQKISWVKSHGKPLYQFDWSKIQENRLVIIGDAHGVSNPDSILTLIKQSRSTADKQCVFFEMSSDYSSEQYLKLLRETTGEPEADLLRRYYGKIANGAIKLGFKLYTVDDPKNWDGTSNTSDYERELHMAATIKDLFETQKCDHAVLIVGKAHVAAKYNYVDNMPQLLLKSGITLTRLNPMQAPNGGREAPSEEWNGICASQIFTPSEALIFENSGIKNDLVTPGFYPPLTTMKFGSFDYSVLFPEGQFEQK